MRPVGVYGISNNAALLVYEIDYEDDMVLAGLSGQEEWCNMCEQYNEDTEEYEPGFLYGEFFVPFCQVMRL